MGTTMIGTLARVLYGFLLACLTAGLVKVLFVMTPYELAASPSGVLLERLGQMALLTLLAATHSAIFAAAFMLIAAGVGEWLKIRTLPYYLLAGVAIALLGFAAQFSSEAGGQPTVLNNYALKAFLTAGFFSGLVYWLSAGRSAGGGAAAADGDATTGVAAPSKSGTKSSDRPRIIVEKSPAVTPPKAAGTLSDRLSKGDAGAAPARPSMPESTATPVPATKPPAPSGPASKGPKPA